MCDLEKLMEAAHMVKRPQARHAKWLGPSRQAIGEGNATTLYVNLFGTVAQPQIEKGT